MLKRQGQYRCPICSEGKKATIRTFLLRKLDQANRALQTQQDRFTQTQSREVAAQCFYWENTISAIKWMLTHVQPYQRKGPKNAVS